jgi:lactobin A/cerein 7B family class IIb bacteriocin
MKQLSLENFGVQELDAREMKETDGGFLGIGIAILVGLLLTSCTLTVVVGDDNEVNAGTSVDSTANGSGNGNTAGHGSGNG